MQVSILTAKNKNTTDFVKYQIVFGKICEKCNNKNCFKTVENPK